MNAPPLLLLAGAAAAVLWAQRAPTPATATLNGAELDEDELIAAEAERDRVAAEVAELVEELADTLDEE